MLDFIVKYWVQELFALIIALVTWLVKQVRGKQKEYQVLSNAIMALLHDRLYKACGYLIEKGFCSIEDRQNLEYLFVPYKTLGGNGTVESLYKKCMDLPLTKGHVDDAQDEEKEV
ncbi:MAG: hypothetical protein ACI4ET_05805 [Bilifractor sp.]